MKNKLVVIIGLGVVVLGALWLILGRGENNAPAVTGRSQQGRDSADDEGGLTAGAQNPQRTGTESGAGSGRLEAPAKGPVAEDSEGGTPLPEAKTRPHSRRPPRRGVPKEDKEEEEPGSNKPRKRPKVGV